MEDAAGKMIMLVEVTTGTLRQIRSRGIYANLAGHEADYICFLSHQGAFVGEVKGIRRNVPLNEIYTHMDSKARTTCYEIGPLVLRELKRTCKLPRGRKRVIPYDEFLDVTETGKMFRHTREG